MGCVQQAVLEFDEEVAAPWRPRLVASPLVASPRVEDEARRPGPARSTVSRPSRPSPSRVGACRPPAVGESPAPVRHPSVPVRRPVVPPPGPMGGRRDPRTVGRRQPDRLRLTYRGRRLAVVLALAAGVALGSWLAPLLGGGAGGDLRLAGQSSVTVESGDTLWSIASSVAGSSDVRVVIDRIRRLNGLHSADLVPGQVLQLP